MTTALHRQALDYLQRGWSVIPMGLTAEKKKPLVKWKRFQTTLPTEHDLQEWFSRPGANGVAIITGPVSGGLAVRDFDTEGGYGQWASANPTLAKSIPTVQTQRGNHVYFISDLSKTIKLADGEYRGAGVNVAPPSLRPPGFEYRWLVPLPAGPLPEIGHEVFIADGMNQSNQSNQSNQKPSSDLSEFSNLSDSLSVDSIITQTVPTKSGERNACVLKLARGLRYNARIAASEVAKLRDIVQQWHRFALPIINTKDFDSTWSDFLYAFDHARYPLGVNPLDLAAMRVDPLSLPEVASLYDGMPTRRLIGLCYQLAIMDVGKRFFLSTHDVARRLGIQQPQVWRLLRMLERDGVIKCTERGNERRATRYQWLGGADLE